MRDVTDPDRARARGVLANALQPVDPGAMLAAMERDPRYHGHAVEVIAQAIVAERAATAESCAVACERVRREHDRAKSYPMEMGGLATECAEACRKIGGAP